MKYRLKHSIVEASRYERGMEDGFICYPIGRTFHQGEYFEKGRAMPRNCQQPVINDKGSYHIINEGDYILTDETGRRIPCKPELFRENYEPVE